MDLQDFKDLLDEYGAEYKESGVSLALKHCPACGSNKYKVLFRVVDVDPKEPFFGRCQRASCNEGYSSIKYLRMIGVSPDKITKIHSPDPDSELAYLTDLGKGQKGSIIKQLDDPRQKNNDLARIADEVKRFVPIPSWPDHPAAKYAVKRGVMPHHYSKVMIDPDSNAVVFLVLDNGQVIGYQKRFVKSDSYGIKTKTSTGFPRNSAVLEFPGKGDILVCEGPFTGIAANNYGFHAIITFGAAVGPGQLVKIFNISDSLGKNIGVAAEDDEGGKKMLNTLRCEGWHRGKDIFVVRPSVGKDLNDAWTAGGTYCVIKDTDWPGPAIPALPAI